MFVIGLVGTSVLVNNGTLKGDSGIWNLTNGLWINAALIGVNLAFAATSFYAARKQDERLNEIHYATMRNAYHGNYSKEMNEKFHDTYKETLCPGNYLWNPLRGPGKYSIIKDFFVKSDIESE